MLNKERLDLKAKQFFLVSFPIFKKYLLESIPLIGVGFWYFYAKQNWLMIFAYGESLFAIIVVAIFYTGWITASFYYKLKFNLQEVGGIFWFKNKFDKK